MDPITTISFVASISQLIGATREVVRLIKSFRDGEEELGDLVNLISIFEENLKGFDRVLRNSQIRISTETLASAINESSETLEDLEKRLLLILKTEKSTIRRLKWVQHKSAFERISERIKSRCSMLHSLVSIAHMEMFLDACSKTDETDIVTTTVSEHSENVSFLQQKPDTPVIEPDTWERVSDVSDYPERCASDTSLLAAAFLGPSPRRSLLARDQARDAVSVTTKGALASARSSISSAAGSIFSLGSSSASSTSSTVASDTDPDMCRGADPHCQAARESQDEPVPNVASVLRRACRFDCYCLCHRTDAGMVEDVASASKPLTFRNGKRANAGCTEPDCAGAQLSNQRKDLSWGAFQKTMFRVLVSHASIGYHLNTYRMVPEGSNAMRYVKHGNLEKLKICIKTGEATPWDTAPDGWSLLHTAVYARQLPTVKYLCDLGADTNAGDLSARRPADLAILKSIAADATKVEHDIARIFSKDDDYLSDFEYTPIHIAVLNLYDGSDRDRPSLQDLIDFVDNANNAPPGTDWKRWKANYRKRSPLFLAIIEQFRVSAAENSGGRKKVIHNLLDQKDRKFHWTPLHWASVTNRADTMKVLIQNGADPFIRSNLNANILHAAVESNALQSLSYALDICKSYPERLDINQPNVWGESPLHMAAQGCLVDCVRLLLEAGADRTIRQENQQVALHYAGLSTRGLARRDTVALLCGDHGATADHINAQDEDGRPPLFDFLDDPKCVEILLRHGARLDIIDASGKNVFHHACIQDENELLQSLLRRSSAGLKTGVLKEKDNAGNTVLIEALRHESVDCAITLLSLGHDVDIGSVVGQDGWAAVHYAAKLGDPALLEATLKHRSFRRGATTRDGKTAEVVAMDSGNWCGKVKELLRKYNSLIDIS